MSIINLTDETQYPPIQSWDGDTPPEGSLFFPDKFFKTFYPDGKRAAGFVNIEHDGTTVTSCTWNEEAYQKWCEENPESEPEPVTEYVTYAELSAAIREGVNSVD